MKIGIINNGIGNVGSVLAAFQFYKYDVSLLESSREIDAVDLLVLAGVGSFSAGVSSLDASEYWDKIQGAVKVEKKPLLGLCLGMHLFATESFEGGQFQGFGWIPGKVLRLSDKDAKVPHIGWAEVQWNDLAFSNGLHSGSFYFMHSYHFVPENPETILATAFHGKSKIVVAVRSGNIIGFQFHPEKSQGDGLRVLKNVVESFS